MRKFSCKIPSSGLPSLICSTTHCSTITVFLLIIAISGVTVLGQGGHSMVFLNASYSGSSYVYRANINQNMMIDDNILTIKCNNTLNPSATVYYGLSSISPHSDVYFNIGHTNGSVRLSVDGLILVNDSRYDLLIYCSSGGINETALLKIHYLLLNQYPPIYASSDRIELTYQENNNITGQNSIIYDFNATDQDRGACSVIIYTITSRHTYNLFQINSTTGVLSFLTPLDYELETQHIIVVQASNPQCPTTNFRPPVRSVKITVEETNDTPPRFSQSVYTTTITEEVGPHSVLNVSCSDPDLGSRIIYSLHNGSNFFSIDHFNGTISIKKGMDYETDPLIVFLVVCLDDNSVPRQIANATIVVNVIPVNEHRPIFAQQGSLSILMNDTVPLNTAIVAPAGYNGSNALENYIVTDADRGSNHAKFNYTLTFTNTTYKDNFDFDRKMGVLRLVKTIIPSMCNTINGGLIAKISGLNLVACDIGDISSCDILNIILYVRNSSCTDYFSRLSSTVDVSELAPVGYPLFSLPCDISLSLNQKFYLNRENRSIVLSDSLDYETKKEYSLELICREKETFSITVKVKPENDHRPKFNSSIFIINLAANQASPDHGPITQLNASDADEDLGGNLTYYFMEPNLYFNLSLDGQLSLINDLRYIEDVFKFTVRVSDGEYSDNATVIIIKAQDESESGEQKQVAVMAVVFSATLALILILLLISWVCTAYLCFQLRKYTRRKGVNSNRHNIDRYYYDTTERHSMENLGRSFENGGTLKSNSLMVPCHTHHEEPEYETIYCKEQQNLPLKHISKRSTHLGLSPHNSNDCYVSMQDNQQQNFHLKQVSKKMGVSPRNSTDCYVSMRNNSSEVLNEAPRLDSRYYDQLPPACNNENDYSCGMATSVPRRTSINGTGGDMETSLEFCGAVESSLEFGARDGISLDFVGPSRVGTGRTSPRTPRGGKFDMNSENGLTQLESLHKSIQKT